MADHLKTMASAEDFEEALAASDSGPIWLLKHSNSCGVSEDAIEEYSAHAEAETSEPHWLLTVQRSPALSRLVATRLGVDHDTPQVILLFGRKARWVASHWNVRQVGLDQARAMLTS
jgi:bacillithiol system protein YtxJ